MPGYNMDGSAHEGPKDQSILDAILADIQRALHKIYLFWLGKHLSLCRGVYSDLTFN